MRSLAWKSLVILLLLAGAVWAQRRFRGYDDDDVPMPEDAAEKTEYVFARFQYPSFYRSRRGGSWATDYPKADRVFLRGVRRLTRIHSRSVEQVVSLDSPDLYDYPWMYAVEVGTWGLSDQQAAKLRDYLDRGGFLMVDDFHADYEWEVFMDSLRRVYPDRPVVEIGDDDQAFHILFDLKDRFQIPGIHYPWSGSTSEKGGVDPHWRGVYDEKGRLVVAICFNMDLGDAWEHADVPQYPEKFAALAYRTALNYIIYSMTH